MVVTHLLCQQVTINITQQVKTINQPTPTFLATMEGPGRVKEIYFVVEGTNLGKVEESKIPVSLLAAFYCFNMQYPKSLTPFYNFLEYVLLDTKMKTSITVSKFLASLHS